MRPLAVKAGIVHFGAGGFHRAHQARYLDGLMNEGEAHEWGLSGVGVLPHDLRTRGPVQLSALVVASWARYAEGTEEQGQPIEVVDRLKDRVMSAAGRRATDPLSFVRDRDLFGTVADDPRFTAAYLAALESLHRRGARATVEAWVAGGYDSRA
jgi:mannitol-1-phosphate/altronate dehydrogenase